MARGLPKEQLEKLSRVKLFSACSQKELREVAKLGTPLDFPAGKELTRQGERGAEAFLMLDGKSSCYIDGRQVATYGAGDFFGDMALLDQGPRSATVKTESPVRAIVFSAQEFGGLLSEAPSIARKMLVELAARLRAAETSDAQKARH